LPASTRQADEQGNQSIIDNPAQPEEDRWQSRSGKAFARIKNQVAKQA